jgi:cupin fold WbuC family metalloprotein
MEVKNILSHYVSLSFNFTILMKKITESLLSLSLEKAATLPRQRTNYNFHLSLDATYQRMLNCLMPDTYCRPHKHSNPAKSESFVILKGRAVVVEFSDSGVIVDHFVLDSGIGNYGVDFLPNTWHIIIALTPCVVFEAKDGPYCPVTDKDFALWAPKEGSQEAKIYNFDILKKLGLQHE